METLSKVMENKNGAMLFFVGLTLVVALGVYLFAVPVLVRAIQAMEERNGVAITEVSR